MKKDNVFISCHRIRIHYNHNRKCCYRRSGRRKLTAGYGD